MVVNASTLEVEATESVSYTVYTTSSGLTGLHRESLSQKQTRKIMNRSIGENAQF